MQKNQNDTPYEFQLDDTGLPLHVEIYTRLDSRWAFVDFSTIDHRVHAGISKRQAIEIGLAFLAAAERLP
ncbi:MAG: hypothetical protein MJA83_05810 [Gammaproteobacteria bacterium]|nr:hypothetical protein [Gammaproteobacteria bacterium]